MKYCRPVVIHRRTKKEAEQAIKDLEKRGFVVTHPLTMQSDGKRIFDIDSKNKHVYSHTTFNTFWVARMEKIERSEG